MRPRNRSIRNRHIRPASLAHRSDLADDRRRQQAGRADSHPRLTWDYRLSGLNGQLIQRFENAVRARIDAVWRPVAPADDAIGVEDEERARFGAPRFIIR